MTAGVVGTPAALHRRSGSAAPGPGFLARPRALWHRRRAVALLVTRDLKVRYASSALGYLWSVLEPLMLAGIYWFVFTQVFTRTVGAEPYLVFLLAGLLPWTWFQGAVVDAARALHTEAKLVRSTNVPREVWVVRVVLSKGVEFLLSLPVLLLFALLYRAPVDGHLLLLVPAAVLMAVLTLGAGLLLAPLVVLVRDLERVVRIALRLGFYASPVIFAVRDVPAPFDTVFALNPLSGILELCRAGFFPGAVQWAHVGLSATVSITLLLVGWTVFARLERTVLKEI
ncbi:ABC-2 type transport system permease protein [Geodermatophilus pulveris]|uniref:Transport permease protein n=1 Tax=Geodermatophilus pulveris TaxID=1564159 RepID=A0A239AZB4_9ACTN|nr:ABC transporter permease [Geodermatophilus pulveris]SNS01055.1 ABC-2 type transport system permease protein [Geodermatophilus pulveris]